MPNYTLSAGRVYLGKPQGGERYVGSSTGVSLDMQVGTVVTQKSEGGVLMNDKVRVISVQSSVELKLDDITPDNLITYFGSTGRPVEYSPRRIDVSFAPVRGDLYPLAEGGFIRVRVFCGDAEISVADNFDVNAGFGIVIAKTNAPDIKPGRVMRFVVDTGRSVSPEIGGIFRAQTGSMRYVENNVSGKNRMFFFPDATFTPKSGLDLKSKSWRELVLQVDITSMPSIMDEERRDDYGFVAGNPAGNDFLTSPFLYTDDYGVTDNG